MYYSLFGAFRHDVFSDEVVPLIIWLQGGPGSGSQFGAFTEIGPIRIKDGKPYLFEYPWNSFGNLLFIDSPLNAGFSKNGDRHGKTQVSYTTTATNHLLNFLVNFYNEFPKLKKAPLYIAGQSYAGHYIPNLARKILKDTDFQKKTENLVKLHGISIGNGWIDPINQINFYDSYLWSTGIVTSKLRDTLTWYQTHTMSNILQEKYQNATNYFNFITQNTALRQNQFGNISMYNFRNYEAVDLSFATFLTKNKAELGADVDYISGNDQIYAAFSDDISRDFLTDLKIALTEIKVLIYNGQQDVMVNNAGVMHFLNSLKWDGAKNWKKTPKTIWTISSNVKGWAKVSGNLWYVLVNGAGHMVPTDQPESAFRLFGHFIQNQHDWKQ